MKTIFYIFNGSSNEWNNQLKKFDNFSFFQTYEWGKYCEKNNWKICRIIQFNKL